MGKIAAFILSVRVYDGSSLGQRLPAKVVVDNDDFEAELTAGAAPNLTHFASRTTYAGGIVNLYDPETGDFNANELREWLVNPEDVKANYALPVSDDDSRMRGMPNLGLSTQEIDDLVALLESTGPRPSDFIIEESGVE